MRESMSMRNAIRVCVELEDMVETVVPGFRDDDIEFDGHIYQFYIAPGEA
jgi:hypothetical protein